MQEEEGVMYIFVFAAAMHYTALKLNFVTFTKDCVE